MSEASKFDDLPPELIKLLKAISKGFEENKKWQEEHGDTTDRNSYSVPPEELTDLVEVGDKKAQKLRDAGYESVDDLKGVSEEELAQVDGIGPAGAGYIAAHIDTDVRWPTVDSGDDKP